MKIAIAHDSLVQYGGAERVLQAMHEVYPDAPVFTLVYDQQMISSRYEDWNIVASPLQHVFKLFPRLQFYLPFIPFALRFFDFSEFDVVLSSSSMWMKGLQLPKHTMHINYCHTPARFLWNLDKNYISEEVPGGLKIFTPVLRFFLYLLRGWDYETAQKVDFFISNSKNVKDRIQKIYNRDSTVIYPFVDTEIYYPSHEKENYFLAGGRLHKHKRIDLPLEVFKKNKQPLHIVGTGRAFEELSENAPDTIKFAGAVSDGELRDEYSGARAFLHPQEEDFGMMALESMACGTPVIAYAAGGALETIVDGKTGILFADQTVSGLETALERFDKTEFLQEDLFEYAEKFSKETFKSAIANFVERHAHRN